MIEMFGNYNLFTLPKNESEAVVITTNGIVKKDGSAVMGAGIAGYARDHFRDIDKLLGNKLQSSGNHAFDLGVWEFENRKMRLVSLPTKNNWRDPSDLDLICRSCRELVKLCSELNITTCYLPCPGCTNGKLDYETVVRPHIKSILDNRFIVVVNRGG